MLLSLCCYDQCSFCFDVKAEMLFSCIFLMPDTCKSLSFYWHSFFETRCISLLTAAGCAVNCVFVHCRGHSVSVGGCVRQEASFHGASQTVEDFPATDARAAAFCDQPGKLNCIAAV